MPVDRRMHFNTLCVDEELFESENKKSRIQKDTCRRGLNKRLNEQYSSFARAL